MEEDKIQEFLKMYEENKKNREPIATKEDVFIEMLKLFIDSSAKRDKKRMAKSILKAKPGMKDHSLWSFVDEELLQQVIKS